MLDLPHRRIRLGRAVGYGLPNDRADVAQIEDALDHLGHLPKREDSGRMRSALEKALRITQERHGLKGDSRALPGGPTERLLNALLAGGLGALVPSRKELPDRRAFKEGLTLRNTVGPEGDNRESDRRWLQSALGVLGHIKLGEALSDDLEDERLADAIESLNRRHGFPDGRTLSPAAAAKPSRETRCCEPLQQTCLIPPVPRTKVQGGPQKIPMGGPARKSHRLRAPRASRKREAISISRTPHSGPGACRMLTPATKRSRATRSLRGRRLICARPGVAGTRRSRMPTSTTRSAS